jgi:hypothetical protein
MVGRGSRRHTAAIPEEAELYRSDPELVELIEETSATDEGKNAQSS